MGKATDFFLPRMYERIDSRGVPMSEPLEASRDFAAYVLLGEPGSGKTDAFEREARACNARYVKARNFSLVKPEELPNGTIVFIDGLDERRAMGGSGHTPIEHIREHLDRLGRPRFRLSCREADWLGDSDRGALEFIASAGKIEVLRLEPLDYPGILALLAHSGIANPQEFLKKARQHQLDAALGNPQILKLLAKAVGNDSWPTSKNEIFARACRVLAREVSIEHQTASPGPRPPIDLLLKAAGYLCAVLLLSGDEGVSLLNTTDSPGIVPLSDLAASETHLGEALRTNLFRWAGESSRTYLHRSVAEHLGGLYLAQRIEDHGLPVERVLAACTGEDGGVAPDLRGLCAWISVHSPKARLAFIERDPLGVVLYGDVGGFTRTDKQQIFVALKREANRYPGFRSNDWTSEPFGGLSTIDMLETIEGVLRAHVTTDGDQAFLDCVLDAVQHGEPMPSLEPLLAKIARNTAYWPTVRGTAMAAIERVNPSAGNALTQILHDIHTGVLEDRDDELLGFLLPHLYKEGRIEPRQIFDYLHRPKQENLIGSYRQFWSPILAKETANDDLPVLIAELAQRRKLLAEEMHDEYIIRSLAGELLVRTLEVHGDAASPDQIYDWLGAGLDKWGHDRLETDERKAVAEWLGARPDLYKAIAQRPVEDCRNSTDVAKCLRVFYPRLFDASPPPDIVEWYLTKASEDPHPDIGRYYFDHAVVWLHRRDGSNVLSEASLDLLDSWVERFHKLLRWREDATSYRLDHWEREGSQRRKKHEEEQSGHKRKILEDFRKLLPQIADGSAPHGVMFELSQVHEGRRIEGRGDTPRERLDEFFDNDAAMIDATIAGLAQVPARADLPTVDAIISSHLAKRFHYIRDAALVGMELKFKADREGVFSLPDTSLEKLCAFWLVKGTSDNPGWYEALAQSRPELVAKILLEYIQRAFKAKLAYVIGVWELGHSPEFAAVAKIALAPLLEAFPLRATGKQLNSWLDPLLKGAMLHMARKDLAALVARKVADTKIAGPQRVYWLASGLLIDAPRYQRPLLKFVRENRSRRGYLATFLANQEPQKFPSIDTLPDSTVAELVGLLAPEASSDLGRGVRRRGASDNLTDLVRALIRTMEQRTSDEVLRSLEGMLDNPTLERWYNMIRAALNTIRVSRRKISLIPLTPREASQVISNDTPTNAGDLSAIVVGHLRDIARKIRNGATNDYKQYWESGKPKVENECRDALLSQLEDRLGRNGKIGIPAAKEGHVANEQRTDVMISFGGATRGFSIPLEAKRENYRKGKETVWTALRTQLIDSYSHYPTANGHGVYLIFWFGGKTLPPSPSGVAPKTPAELETQLRDLLSPEESRIHVVVMDCSIPN